MTSDQRVHPDQRILVLTPRGRDATVVAQVLGHDGLGTETCSSLSHLVTLLSDGAGLAFVTEEALERPELNELTLWLARQPSWSDFPLVVLATKQPGRRSPQALATLKNLGNVVLLERPVNAETLVSAARSALRSRNRQYEARQHLEAQIRIGRENERLYEAESRALREAAEAREALALALDAAELGTFHCPVPLGEIIWNNTCKAHFWLPADAFVDIDIFYSIIHPDDRERTRTAITAAIEARLPYDVEYRTVSPAGQCRWIRAKGRAYYSSAGEPVRFDGVTIDISHQKALEAERETLLDAERFARGQAELASRTKDEFLATLSHELRTPLSAILGWSHVLRQQAAGSADLLKGVDTIERNARAQARLIDELLDMSRIIAGTLRLDFEPLMPSVIAESAIASLQPTADLKTLRIERAIDPQAGPVSGDAHRLQQIVWNLLSNAVKFTPPGGRIRVSLTREESDVVLAVTDSGDGISSDFLPFVFDRFRQADGSSTRSHGGLGLGLAIVRNLVQLHGGSVQAASEGIGQGAIFTVRLPVRPSQPAAAGDCLQPAVTRTEAPSSSAQFVSLEGTHILLVDDETDGREMMARILSDRGAAITAAASADEAMDAIQAKSVDILISDIGMPRVNGYQLMQRVRGLGYRFPAIALTAFARNEDRKKALAAGFSVHLAKPVEPSDLVSFVAQLIGRTGVPGGVSRPLPEQEMAVAESLKGMPTT
jgi:signal transduction histidine kinase/ActR/RegA family two-component response regulator